MKVVVIGSGPSGVRFCHELLKHQPNSKLVLFGNEPYQPYNRVQLSALLAGEIDYDDILSSLPDSNRYPGFEHRICKVESIQPAQKTIVDANGAEHSYDRLVIATGSRPHVPTIDGVTLTGVYTFRSLKDAEFLYNRVARSRHVVVMGGGLLGIEAARALQRFNTKVTLIQQAPRIMNRQLDDKAAALLLKKITTMGIHVITNSGVRHIKGNERVSSVITRSGEEINCDTVLLCTGITPNIELARAAKIKVGKGITVDDSLRTSDEHIFAIGECCEHDGVTYGLVNPGLEQAAVAADTLCKGTAQYKGSAQISRLKVVGETICSMGTVADLQDRPQQSLPYYSDPKNSIYRKLVVHKARIIGAVCIGEWPEIQRVQEAYQHGRRIWPWQRLWFRLTGKLWFSDGGQDARQWPASAVICQCNNITQGELVEAINEGYDTPAALAKQTGASTVCGSCKPLLMQLTGASGPQPKEKAWGLILGASIVAMVLALTVLLAPALTVSDTVQAVPWHEEFWNDKYWKQVTGFSLLGMSAIGLLMSLRKRIKSQRLGEFSYWRLLHIGLGVLCAATLVAHTGLNLGSNLNQYLMINFLLVLGLGALASTVVSLSHLLQPGAAKTLRKFWSWLHILVTWPLPVLLAFHIISVYYF